MPQLRLTQKFATDCKIKQLGEPMHTTHPLDDWFIDRMIDNHKKIAIITHAQTKFTFFIPYAEAGGAKQIPAYFKLQLEKFFNDHALPDLAKQIHLLFSEEISFCKTVDKKVLGHINDFKYCAASIPDDPAPVNWQERSQSINHMPINAARADCTFPYQEFNQLLGIMLP